MLTSIIGFPRVGNLRELKFATEKYFKHQISQERLQTVAKEIREKQWRLLKENGIDLIPSNDFSFYDTLLDSAALFNIIPSRFKELNLSDLDTYFAMSRGYQGDHGDVRALAMKKWFNTNYHYMVPEIEDDTEIKLTGTKLFDEFHEALHLGILTKPVITGPFTLLKLIRYTGEKQLPDFVEPMIHAYEDLISKAQGTEISWIQFDEPYLVHDLSSDDIALFKKIYTLLLAKKGNLKVLVQTYFGDVRDIYHELTSLDFDGIGLDFIEGKETKSLIKKEGFPKNKLLFVGIVNGKNIWKNHYGDSLATITWLKNSEISTVINTSCSLLHVPYTLKNETKLDADYTKHFAFAEEKLEELNELKILSDLDSYETHPAFIKNLELFSSKRKNSYDPEVSKRVSEITDQDFTRLPDFFEREKIQKDVFKLPLLSTTTIGSFPQTLDVKTNRSAFRKGEISESEYVDFNRKKIAECVKLQEEIGLDVLVHGEYERNDMVEYFGQQLNGYLFTEKAWVQSYGTRCVKPPIIWGDVSRPEPMTVSWSVYAQSLTDHPMKGMLTGPVTILNWSFPREDISVKESTYQIALAIRDEVLNLEANGIHIIQIDEAALREKLPLRKSDWYCEYLDWAIPAFRLVHSKVKPETQIHTHMCYSEFTDIIPAIDDMDADVITFEASRSDLLILDSLKENHFKTEVGPGVYDIHSPRVPSVEEIKTALNKMLDKIEIEKLWVNPDCGLKTRGNEETTASLKNLVAATKELREVKDF
ncbi:5-methyltetrahydropteroyltriglutamate--homocysteine S-methyltransferase [Anaerostipes hadrus]|uniref:5-methyltetrahydropteroyltriglutamate-- homocysteine S-methyltransferase n=1 Tax=Anaerostipes hadrus TaxID=649756 RepID=UPI00156FBA07|nr:5-methyltetrahydropteroyltriglutamate--homocysteine S-methyltransferase [Anaerostipes hadrus]NSH01888.1 5-methyltetrahydropteroyltriglutamate--homocysteine S-methyltransferase [Anaerostipes hadrus]NSH30873.1 5-methyltetrahydropteroyltriglutamate--homocysteine S-methyltransferase [Anaerostipes hadrus]NSJ72632.1 5-methyltetrahydropteroyltriglutamate--homocysteine S-methyltransferase [Anaerostipes hadrus]